MSGSWSKFLPLPVLVAALGALYSNPSLIVPVLDKYAGRVADFQPAAAHLHHGPLNNDKCWINTGSPSRTTWSRTIFLSFTVGQACEDVRIHEPSGEVFLGMSIRS